MKKIILSVTLFTFLNGNSQNKLDIDFRTGDDNLQIMEFQENPEVVVILRNKPEVKVTNINKGQEWPNNSFRRVTVPLPADISVVDIKELIINRKPVYGRDYIWDYLKKDNWTLKALTVTATIMENGQSKRYELYNNYTRGIVFRFIFEGGDNIRTGTSFKAELKPVTPPPHNRTQTANMVITAVFGTGSDNLEGGSSNNVNLIIRFRNATRPLSITNLNNRAKWENNTIRTINNREIPNSAGYNIDDIEKVELRHTGGGGMFADNWNLDKFKLTISKGDQTKVLVDEAGTPIHRFTGDSRKKEFVIQ